MATRSPVGHPSQPYTKLPTNATNTATNATATATQDTKVPTTATAHHTKPPSLSVFKTNWLNWTAVCYPWLPGQ